MSPSAVASAPVTVEVLQPAAAEDAQRRVAGALAVAGLRAGDRVAFSLGSSAALLVCVLGALRSGIIPVLLNAMLLPAERDLLIADAEPALVVGDAAGLERLLQGPAGELAEVPLGRPIHYTSGTTGRPKGVWSGVLSEEQARRQFDDEADLWGFDAADTHLVCSPMYHSVSVRFASGTLLRGGRLVILSRFEAGVALRALRDHRPTTTFMAPTALQRLLHQRDLPERFESLRLLVHAGSPCPPAVKRAAMARVRPGALWEFYGSTEGQFTVCSPEEWLQRPGTVGRARPGRRLHVDDRGVIWCRPPDFARFSYWHDPEATATAWDDGAFTVGDLGRLDDDGYLFIDGRRDDLVISGGVNVYPAEVEAALTEVRGVRAVAVFGLPHPDWGQEVCAAVVGAASEEELRAQARRMLAPHKRPKRYFTVADLPRTTTGKVQRTVLADAVAADAVRDSRRR